MSSSKHATRAPATRVQKPAAPSVRGERDAKPENIDEPVPYAPTSKPAPAFRWPDARGLAEEVLTRLTNEKSAEHALDGMLSATAAELETIRHAVLRDHGDPHAVANTIWNLQQRIELVIELHDELRKGAA